MSGPKIDLVDLERRRREEIERQRQERLRKIREETGKLNTEISKIKTQIDYIDRHLSSLVRNVENEEEMASTVARLKEVKAAYKGRLTDPLEFNVPADPEAISGYTHKLAGITKNAIAGYSDEVKPLEERITEYNRQLEIQNKVASISKGFSGKVEAMDDIGDFDLAARMDSVACSDIEVTVKEKAAQILSEIEELVNSESVQESDMKNLLAIADNIHKKAFETNASFEAAAIEYNVMKAGVVRSISVFDEIYQDYYAEYVVYLDSINRKRTVPMDIMPKKKYNFATIEELQAETALLAQESKTASEKNYIREQIDDVMRLFKYNMSEEIVLDTNQVGSHYICENKSGRSAIHVHISDKKQVMMEIVGIGETTSAPVNSSVSGIIVGSSDLDEREQNNLLLEQGSFCELHPRIIDELRKRDLVFNEKSRKPPNVKYSKKVLPVAAGNNAIPAESTLINVHAAERIRPKGLKAKLREMKRE